MCGIFAFLFNNKTQNKDKWIKHAFYQIKNRGRESIGYSYVSFQKKVFEPKTYKLLGSVDNFFKEKHVFPKNIDSMIGHVRYSTSLKVTSDSEVLFQEAQPFQTDEFSLVHNGNIPFHVYNKLKKEYCLENLVKTNSDTELITQLLPKLGETIEKQLLSFLSIVQGVYCLLLITKEALFIVRDSYGVRPLMICRTPNYTHISSEHSKQYLEKCKQNIGETVEIPPNSIWKVTKDYIIEISGDSGKLLETNSLTQNFSKPNPITLNSPTLNYPTPNPKHFCSFEMIYFMDRYTVVYNQTVEQIRFKLGVKIGNEEQQIPKNKNSCIVVGCPNTAIPAGKGFAHATGIKYCQVIHKKKDCGRTFILPTNNQRIEYCSKRIYIDDKKVKGKEVFIVDDSVVRGNTSRSIINKLRNAGATKVHFRVISPPVRNPCHYGIDFPTHSELIGFNRTENAIGDSIGADSIRYCSLDNMKFVMDGGKGTLCTSCFDGVYNKKLMDW